MRSEGVRRAAAKAAVTASKTTGRPVGSEVERLAEGRPRNPQQRLEININELTKAHLIEVSAVRQSSIADAVRVLIGIGHFIWRAHKDGHTILLEKDGDTDRVIFDF